MENIKNICVELIILKRDNEKIMDYIPGFLPGQGSIKRLSSIEWDIYNRNKKRISELENKIYKKLGLWNYLIYKFNRFYFYKKFKIL